MKKIIIIILSLIITVPAFSQKAKVPKPPFKVTKAQMYEDYDQFLHIVETYCPQIEVRMKTGYDMMGVLRERRGQIANIKNYWEFILFMDGSVRKIMDMHARTLFEAPTYAGSGNSFYDSTGLYRIQQGLSQWISERYNAGNYAYPMGKYIDGYYYVQAYDLINPVTKDTVRLRNARITAYDYQPIDRYVRKLMGNLPASQCRYDFKWNKYYTPQLYLDMKKTVKLTDENDSIFAFDMAAYTIRKSFSGIEEVRNMSSEEFFSRHRERLPMEVCYFPEQKTLYIYTKEMFAHSGTDFPDSIKSAARGKRIDKVIFDVRDNPGGSDYFWMDILSAIIKDTLHFRTCGALNANDEVRAFYTAECPETYARNRKKGSLIFLNGKKVMVPIDDRAVIPPDSNSLNFEGPIYILQNQHTYSAAHSLAATARQSSQLVSVGESTGQLAGCGINAWSFQLKHSHFTFMFEPVLDVTDAMQWEDVFHCIPEIEVYPTLKEWNEYNGYRNIMDSEEFLPKYDYLFKYIINLKN